MSIVIWIIRILVEPRAHLRARGQPHHQPRVAQPRIEAAPRMSGGEALRHAAQLEVHVALANVEGPVDRTPEADVYWADHVEWGDLHNRGQT